MTKYQRIPALNSATTITDTDKLIVETAAATDATKHTRADKLKVYIPMKNHLGEIINSALPLDDDRLHLLDGSQLNRTNYPSFIDHMASLYNASSTANYFFYPYEGIKNRFTMYGNPTVSGNELIFDNDNSTEKQYIVSDVTTATKPKSQFKIQFYFPLYFNTGSLTKKRIIATYAEPNDISTRRLEIGFNTSGHSFARIYALDGVTLRYEYDSSTYSGSYAIGEGYYITNLGWLFASYSETLQILYWNGPKGESKKPWGSGSSLLDIGCHHLIIGNTPFDSDCDGFIGKFNTTDGYILETPYSGETSKPWEARGTGTITAEEQWASTNSTYGIVGKYAYTSSSNTVRIPKIDCVADYEVTDTALGNISQINYTSGTEKLTTLKQYTYVVVK